MAVRGTEALDITKEDTVNAFLFIMELASSCGMQVHVWASIPCTAGCPWEYVNSSRGIQTGNPEATVTIIHNVGALCKRAVELEGDFTWEWSERTELWKWEATKLFFDQFETYEVKVPLHAVGCHFYKRIGGEMTEVFLKKNWKIRTTNKALHTRLAQYHEVQFPDGCAVQQVRGKFGKQSAIYPKAFTQQIWKAICESYRSTGKIEEETSDQ